jgi:hypothetical protein
VHFLLVTYSLGKQRKVTRRGAKRYGQYSKKYPLQLSVSASLVVFIVTKLNSNLAWIPASAGMTIRCMAQYFLQEPTVTEAQSMRGESPATSLHKTIKLQPPPLKRTSCKLLLNPQNFNL